MALVQVVQVASRPGSPISTLDSKCSAELHEEILELQRKRLGRNTSRNSLPFINFLVRFIFFQFAFPLLADSFKIREHFECILRTFHLIGTAVVSKERNLGETDRRAECFLFPAFPGTHHHITCNGTHAKTSNIPNPNPFVSCTFQATELTELSSSALPSWSTVQGKTGQT